MPPRILVVAGTVRAGSHNARLAALAAKELTLAEADVTLISLADYALPLFSSDRAPAPPENAINLKRMFCAHRGVFMVAPQMNAALTPLLVNALAWMSCVREGREPAMAAFRNRAFAIASASNDGHGGLFALTALRQMLELGCGALVIPEQVSVADAERAFDDMDDLRDERVAGALRQAAARLVATAQLMD